VTTAEAPAYDRVFQTAHWVIAALTVVVVALGWASAGAPRNRPQRDLLFLLYRSIGLTVLAAMVLRSGWRWRHPAPPLPPTLARFEKALARCTHLVIYLILIVMPIAGYLNAAAEGHEVALFGGVAIPPVLPEHNRFSQVAIAVHLVGQYPLYFFVMLHVAAALFHGAVRRDGILERMLPLRRSAERPSAR